ncbi:olfactory receptor 10A7-like [Osmerus eperlanus]|uniref:olfactory receptor 10A7-like n=1 Tax=Osmerus eperlanus TaxID=29151 RepID=UPI002E14D0D3
MVDIIYARTHMEPLTITLMAFDRLIAISYPLRYHIILSNRTMCLLIVVIWAIGTCVDPTMYFKIASTLFNCVLWTNFCLIIVSYMRIIYAVIKMSSSTHRKKTFSTCISHVVVVACFFFPKMVLSLSQVKNIGFSLTFSIRNGISICSTLGPSLVNPYVYGLNTKEIRNHKRL